MKTAGEFFERYDSDEDFRKEVQSMIHTLKGNGAENLFAAMAKAAESLGFAVTEDDVKAFRRMQSNELADELLDNIAGGFPRDCSSCSAFC